MGLLARILPAALKRWMLTSLDDGSEDKFSRVFHASPDWIVITRLADGLIVDANLGFQALSGYSPAEVLGHSMAEFQVWAVPEQRQRLVDELLQHGAARDRLIQLRRRDGTVRDCMVNAAMIALTGETRSHAVWIARDVTEQNAIHEQFRAAFRLTPDSISISRLRDGLYWEVNAAFERLMGLGRAQMIGKTSMELNVWADPAQRDALAERLATQTTVNDYFMRINTRDKQVREIVLNAAVFDARGERYLIALLRDVTDARKAEIALQESEARFARLFEKSPMPMCYSSDDRGLGNTQWNQAWFDAFGFDPASAQGQSGLALNIWVHPQDRAHLLDMPGRGEASSDMEVQLRRADGTLRWVWVSTRVFEEAHRVLFVSSYFDITERRLAQEQVQELNAQLEARVSQRTSELQTANRELWDTLEALKRAKDHLVQSEKLAALGALVAGVAHELNTPIGNGLTVASSLEHRVETFDQLMAAGLKRSDLHSFVGDIRSAADILVRNLTRAGALVAGFKQVAVDQASAQRRKFSLAAVVSEILVMLHPSIRKSVCTVVPDIEEGLEMDSFPGPLGQALTNLINNAMVHGFGGRSQGHISIRARTTGDPASVQVEIQDDGNGIAPDDLRRVFEPFFTTRLGQGGSGLGLHIVHNIVTSVLGGRVDVHSEWGRGATFTLQLPLCAPERTEAAQFHGAGR